MTINDRVTPGVPAGGQFAAYNRAEGNIQLVSVARENEAVFATDYMVETKPSGEALRSETELEGVDANRVWTFTNRGAVLRYTPGKHPESQANGPYSYIITAEPWTDPEKEYLFSAVSAEDCPNCGEAGYGDQPENCPFCGDLLSNADTEAGLPDDTPATVAQLVTERDALTVRIEDASFTELKSIIHRAHPTVTKARFYVLNATQLSLDSVKDGDKTWHISNSDPERLAKNLGSRARGQKVGTFICLDLTD
jgi:hypothetical protein